MRTLLQALGVLAGIITISTAIAAIWLDDGRWGRTAYVIGVVCAVFFAVAPLFPARVPHAEQCGGC